MFLSQKPYIIAHRGSRPENTMQGFLTAKKNGCHMYECDVRLSKDQVPMVIHDKKIDRTTDKKGYVTHLTSKEMISFGIPTFEHLAAFISSQPTTALVVEFKSMKWWWKNIALVDKVLALTHQYSITHRCIFISFKPSIVSYLKSQSDEYNLDIHIGYLYGPFKGFFLHNDPFTIARKYMIDSLWLHHSLINDEVVEKCKANSLDIYAWTVNNHTDICRMTDLNISGIVTDFPELYMSSPPSPPLTYP